MATWTTIPDSSLEPGKPIRSIDALALRDNPVAIAEGASGAPKIADGALGSTATTAGTDWVNSRIAGSSAGAVGTYAFLHNTTSADYAPGATLAGSSLKYSAISILNWDLYTASSGSAQTVGGSYASTSPDGTWRCMGVGSNLFLGGSPSKAASLWLRIS